RLEQEIDDVEPEPQVAGPRGPIAKGSGCDAAYITLGMHLRREVIGLNTEGCAVHVKLGHGHLPLGLSHSQQGDRVPPGCWAAKCGIRGYSTHRWIDQSNDLSMFQKSNPT